MCDARVGELGMLFSMAPLLSVHFLFSIEVTFPIVSWNQRNVFC